MSQENQSLTVFEGLLQLALDVVCLVRVYAHARAFAVITIIIAATGVPMEVGTQRGRSQEEFDTGILVASKSLIRVVDLKSSLQLLVLIISFLPGGCIWDGRKPSFL